MEAVEEGALLGVGAAEPVLAVRPVHEHVGQGRRAHRGIRAHRLQAQALGLEELLVLGSLEAGHRLDLHAPPLDLRLQRLPEGLLGEIGQLGQHPLLEEQLVGRVAEFVFGQLLAEEEGEGVAVDGDQLADARDGGRLPGPLPVDASQLLDPTHQPGGLLLGRDRVVGAEPQGQPRELLVEQPDLQVLAEGAALDLILREVGLERVRVPALDHLVLERAPARVELGGGHRDALGLAQGLDHPQLDQAVEGVPPGGRAAVAHEQQRVQLLERDGAPRPLGRELDAQTGRLLVLQGESGSGQEEAQSEGSRSAEHHGGMLAERATLV